MRFQMYITSTIRTKSSRLAKPVLCLGTLCAAFLTGLKRVSEYRNHCSDVIAGFILGAAIALFLVSPYRLYVSKLSFCFVSPETIYVHVDAATTDLSAIGIECSTYTVTNE